MFDIEAELKKLPALPGVYLMHDANDVIIYVGKAVILRNRVRSYFRTSTKKTMKIQQMVKQIAWFEYVVTDSELEALVLENNLIKEHQPKYNTMLKDDKTYPYIKVTVDEEYPRIIMTRKVAKDSAKYFGPYVSSEAIRDVIEVLRKLYKIRTCNSALNKEAATACLYYHLDQCEAPCLGAISKDDYAEKINKAIDFLNGNYKPILNYLQDKMMECSDEMNYEKAAEYRDLLGSVKKIAQKQKITDTAGENRDVIGIAISEESVIIQVFFVRGGKLIGREHYYMKQARDEGKEDILSAFLMQYYSGTPFIPKEIILPFEPAQMDMIAEWLCSAKGSKVSVIIPQKGKKEKLLELAMENANLLMEKDLEKIRHNYAKTQGAVSQIEKLLSIDGINRIEAFDISHISGFESVGSMVVYEGGKPKKNDYRKFKIESVIGPDDYASMEEVLTRRFEHGLRADESRNGFSDFPDVIFMDGGKGQVNVAEQVLKKLNLEIPVCGMVKDDNHRTRGLYYNNVEIPIDRTSEAFKLITRIQDEAHRFAITFHRGLRSRKQVHSVLDDIPGVGTVRRKALMKHFESIEDVKNASVDELSEIPGFNEAAAKAVYDFFRGV